MRVTARAGRAPPGSFCALSPVQRGWRLPGGQAVVAVSPLSVPHARWPAGIAAGPPSPWAARAGGQGSASSGLRQIRPGDLCPTWGQEWRPWGRVPCHPCVRASQKSGWSSPWARPGRRCPSASTGNVCPVAGDRLGDSTGSDRATQGHGWVFPYPDSGPQSVPTAPRGAGGGMWGRASAPAPLCRV